MFISCCIISVLIILVINIQLFELHILFGLVVNKQFFEKSIIILINQKEILLQRIKKNHSISKDPDEL